MKAIFKVKAELDVLIDEQCDDEGEDVLETMHGLQYQREAGNR